jgi:hypothetical protein
MGVLGRARNVNSRAQQHRVDEPAKLSLSMVAFEQSPLPFRLGDLLFNASVSFSRVLSVILTAERSFQLLLKRTRFRDIFRQPSRPTLVGRISPARGFRSPIGNLSVKLIRLWIRAAG